MYKYPWSAVVLLRKIKQGSNNIERLYKWCLSTSDWFVLAKNAALFSFASTLLTSQWIHEDDDEGDDVDDQRSKEKCFNGFLGILPHAYTWVYIRIFNVAAAVVVVVVFSYYSSAR